MAAARATGVVPAATAVADTPIQTIKKEKSMKGETPRRFLGDLAETHLSRNRSDAARIGTAIDSWVQQRDQVAPVRDPNEVVVELRLTQLLRVMELPTYAVKLTADDVDDLCRRLRGQ